MLPSCLRSIVFGAALLATTPLGAADAAAQAVPHPAVRATADAIDASAIARDAATMASDAWRGRLTPSHGLDSAQAYVAERLERLGITPRGDSGTYLQWYTVRTATLDTAATTAVVGDQRYRYGDDFVVTSMLRGGQYSGGVVYVGPGLRSEPLGIDPYAGVDVRGKWLLVHAPARWPAGTTAERLGTPGRDYTTVRDEARRRGAVGILTLPTPAVMRGWERTRDREVSGRDLDPARGRAYSAYPLPQLGISHDVLAAVLAGTGLTATALLEADSTRAYPASFEARALTVNLVAREGAFRAANVVGLVPGSDPTVAEEWIAIVSHLDGAVGRGVTADGDSVYNAADDNASGSAGNLAIARALAEGPRPRRPVLLVWDSGEEVGLWGTRHLANGPLGERLVAMVNIDMIGGTKAPGTDHPGEEELAGPGAVYVTGPLQLSTGMEAQVQHALAAYGYATAIRDFDTPASQFFYPRTDASPFLENGIPVVQYFTGLQPRYHRQTDEAALLDPVKMAAVTRQAYVTAWHIANGAERPTWNKPVPPTLWFVTPRR